MAYSVAQEGLSSNRAPFFDGSNYAFWSARMKSYLMALEFESLAICCPRKSPKKSGWRITKEVKAKYKLAQKLDKAKMAGIELNVEIEEAKRIEELLKRGC